MSMLAARRAALRAVPCTRNFAAAAGKSTYRQEMEATVHHAEGKPFILPCRDMTDE